MANQISWVSGEGDQHKKVMFHVGDTIRVHYKLIEKEKVAGKTKREVHEETHERTQAFEGIVLAVKGSGDNTMFTVRHIGASAIGVERIFPLVSPWIKKIEVKKHGDVRRAKLYFLRYRTGKSANRIDEVSVRPAATA
ncbi:50S ribosomal protein L19 [Candidatus Gottesmanbacteria bacterium]|nr:50S ribosomal protein L19 [Candidatus Gottesmanbacteria bacterium]